MGKLIKIKKDDNPEAKSSDPESPVENDGLIYVVDILKYINYDTFLLCQPLLTTTLLSQLGTA